MVDLSIAMLNYQRVFEGYPPFFWRNKLVNENPGLPPGRPGRLRLWYRAGFQKSSGRFQQILQDGTILVKCMAKWLNNKTNKPISSYLGTWSMIFPMSHLDGYTPFSEAPMISFCMIMGCIATIQLLKWMDIFLWLKSRHLGIELTFQNFK